MPTLKPAVLQDFARRLLAAGGMTDKNDSTIKWAGTTFSLAFSATYN